MKSTKNIPPAVKILGVLLTTLVLIAGCDSEQTVGKTLITNVNGYSFDTPNDVHQFTSLLVENGVVTATGGDQLHRDHGDAVVEVSNKTGRGAIELRNVC